MQTSNRLLYKPVKKAQVGTLLKKATGIQQMATDPDLSAMTDASMAGLKKVEIPKTPEIGGKIPNLGGGLAGMAGDALGAGITAAFGGEDHIAGAKEAGLDANEISEIENAGKGLGTAANIAGAVGDLGANIPGPWGFVASGVGKGLEAGLGILQGNKQGDAAKGLIASHVEREGDKSKMEGIANLSQKGGVLYKKPNKILSLISGGAHFKVGGKAPELKWNHSFSVTISEGSLEKKTRPVKVFKRGGKFDNPDKTNVIVAGARHHESNSLGDKGVPVIDDSGEKVFEVETGELILTKDATNKIEAFLAKYKKVEVDEDKAHNVLKNLGSYFKGEVKDNLHNYEKNVV